MEVLRKFMEYGKIAGKLLSASKPLHLTFFVTSKCNYQCKTCFNWRNLNSEKKELSLKEINKVSESIGKLGWLLISGGEPFLRKDIDKIIKIFQDRCKPFVTTIVTNGFNKRIIKDKMMRILNNNSDSPINVIFSIDGFEKTHKKIRGKNLKQTIDSYFKIKKLQEKYPLLSVGVATLYNKHNQKEIDELYRYVKDELDPDNWCLTMIRGNPKDECLKDIDTEKYFDTLRISQKDQEEKQKYYKVPFKNSFLKKEKIKNDIINKTLTRDDFRFKCFAGGKSIVLREDGTVMPCEIIDNNLGNVRDFDYDLKKIIKSPESKNFRDKVKKEKCSCTHECNISTNIMFDPKKLLKII